MSRMIYLTNVDQQMRLQKDDTVTIQVGFIAENNTADITYLAISAIDEPNDLYQQYALKIKE